MLRSNARILSVVLTTLCLWGGSCNKNTQVDPKERELDSLPVGMEVVHTPNPVKAEIDSSNRRRCVYKTTVTATSGPLRMQEFGAFGWQDGRWSFSTMTGKPFTTQDFADWYSCPNAELETSASYADPHNFSGGSLHSRSKTKWYYIAVNEKGERVKGEAVVDELPAAGGIFDPTETELQHRITKAVGGLVLIALIFGVVAVVRSKKTLPPPYGFPPPGYRPPSGYPPLSPASGGTPPPLPPQVAGPRLPPPLPPNHPTDRPS